MPHQVPFQFPNVAEICNLAFGLLNAVFAELKKPCICRLGNGLGGDGLADCEKHNFLRTAAA